MISFRSIAESAPFIAPHVAKLINAIEKSKDVTLSKFINALGIRLVGKESSDILAQNYKTINERTEKNLLKKFYAADINPKTYRIR